jgi:hypothetical protein
MSFAQRVSRFSRSSWAIRSSPAVEVVPTPSVVEVCQLQPAEKRLSSDTELSRYPGDHAAALAALCPAFNSRAMRPARSGSSGCAPRFESPDAKRPENPGIPRLSGHFVEHPQRDSNPCRHLERVVS